MSQRINQTRNYINNQSTISSILYIKICVIQLKQYLKDTFIILHVHWKMYIVQFKCKLKNNEQSTNSRSKNIHSKLNLRHVYERKRSYIKVEIDT